MNRTVNIQETTLQVLDVVQRMLHHHYLRYWYIIFQNNKIANGRVCDIIEFLFREDVDADHVCHLLTAAVAGLPRVSVELEAMQSSVVIIFIGVEDVVGQTVTRPTTVSPPVLAAADWRYAAPVR